jgi:hypothetical protein
MMEFDYENLELCMDVVRTDLCSNPPSLSRNEGIF